MYYIVTHDMVTIHGVKEHKTITVVESKCITAVNEDSIYHMGC
jgi:hypothetical protein